MVKWNELNYKRIIETLLWSADSTIHFVVNQWIITFPSELHSWNVVFLFAALVDGLSLRCWIWFVLLDWVCVDGLSLRSWINFAEIQFHYRNDFERFCFGGKNSAMTNLNADNQRTVERLSEIYLTRVAKCRRRKHKRLLGKPTFRCLFGCVCMKPISVRSTALMSLAWRSPSLTLNWF